MDSQSVPLHQVGIRTGGLPATGWMVIPMEQDRETESVTDDFQVLDAMTRQRPGCPDDFSQWNRVVRTSWRLMEPDGCPWDRKQTHQSLAAHMLEEAYELVDAIENGSIQEVSEELGDVLLQVLLHSQIAARSQEFTLEQVAQTLNEKLVRRHPHVFSDQKTDSADAVQGIWEQVKQKERAAKEESGRREGLLDSIPKNLPALSQAQKIAHRAAKVGFIWESTQGVLDKVDEEIGEFLAEEPGSQGRQEEFGDLLFALCTLADMEGIDAERALRQANAKFRARFSHIEERVRQEGNHLSNYDLEAMDKLWDEAKELEGPKASLTDRSHSS